MLLYYLFIILSVIYLHIPCNIFTLMFILVFNCHCRCSTNPFNILKDRQKQISSFKHCGLLMPSNDTPFKSCLDALGPALSAQYLESCSVDVRMLYKSDRAGAKQMACDALEMVLKECTARGIHVGTSWRTKSACRKLTLTLKY